MISICQREEEERRKGKGREGVSYLLKAVFLENLKSIDVQHANHITRGGVGHGCVYFVDDEIEQPFIKGLCQGITDGI